MIRTEDDLLDAIRTRCDQLRISYESIDQIAGLPDGNAAKCLARPPFKRFSTRSLLWVLAALGYGLELKEDPEALARLQNRFDPKHDRYTSSGDARNAPIIRTIRRSFFRKIGAKGVGAAGIEPVRAGILEDSKIHTSLERVCPGDLSHASGPLVTIAGLVTPGLLARPDIRISAGRNARISKGSGQLVDEPARIAGPAKARTHVETGSGGRKHDIGKTREP